MTRNFVETVMGAIVLLIAAGFVTFAYFNAHLGHVSGYPLTAKFDHIEGLAPGSEVRVSGIRVGEVTALDLDPKTYQAVVSMRVGDTVKLPVDSVASITSAGLLGDKFLQLVPGADDQMLAPGSAVRFTQAPMSLESLIGQAVFSVSGNKSGGAGSSAPANPPAPAPQAPQTSSPQPSAPQPSSPAPSAPPAQGKPPGGAH